ncbi:MAG: MBL fold metallo-hydrolase [Oligoflexales bacterium]|nr:MBL fold metallo-hydrolase [Oligoflexales bacterium]
MIQETFPVGPLQSNCTILADPLTRDAMVIDPGGDVKKILKLVREMEVKVIHILHTHGHVDHILGSGELKKHVSAPFWLHKGDEHLWKTLESQCRMYGLPYYPAPDCENWLTHNGALPMFDGIALHTPGHTPGSTCFYFQKEKLVIAGDTLFYRSIGRTDLPMGSYRDIENSIRKVLYRLPDDVRVITGHGPDTMIGDEKKFNEFIRE